MEQGIGIGQENVGEYICECGKIITLSPAEKAIFKTTGDRPNRVLNKKIFTINVGTTFLEAHIDNIVNNLYRHLTTSRD